MRKQPPIPVATVVREPRIDQVRGIAMSGTERACLIAVAIMLTLLFSASILLVHLPQTASGW